MKKVKVWVKNTGTPKKTSEGRIEELLRKKGYNHNTGKYIGKIAICLGHHIQKLSQDTGCVGLLRLPWEYRSLYMTWKRPMHDEVRSYKRVIWLKKSNKMFDWQSQIKYLIDGVSQNRSSSLTVINNASSSMEKSWQFSKQF